MSERTIKLQKVAGKRCIGTSDLVYCNTKYHSPYLAILEDPDSEPVWQEKVKVGYGKRATTYYSVESLKPGDLIKAAGGSGGNKYPYTGYVVSLDQETLTVKEVGPVELSNILAEKKQEKNNE